MLDSCKNCFDPLFGFFFPNTEQSIRGYCLRCDILLTITLLTSKPVRRLVQASVSPLLADWTFSITIPIRIRCSSTMEAPRSASSRLSGASGWIEVTGATGRPPSFEGCCSPDSGAAWVSGIVFDWGTNRSRPPSRHGGLLPHVSGSRGLAS